MLFKISFYDGNIDHTHLLGSALSGHVTALDWCHFSIAKVSGVLR